MSSTMTTQNAQPHASSTDHTFAEAAWLDTYFIAMQPEYEEMLR